MEWTSPEPLECQIFSGDCVLVGFRQAPLSYAPHHCELPSIIACMLHIRNGVNLHPPKEELQSFQDASPFQHHEDPSVVNARVGAGESVSKMPGSSQ